PWGGATALNKTLFDELQVKTIWEENIVDDVSLAACLKKARIRVMTPADATMRTPLDGTSLTSWMRWLTRQWLYLKYCLPGSWLAAGLPATFLHSRWLWRFACLPPPLSI
ncbi:hypothetical protein ACFL0Q_03400, partial [Thermodesulfobacteriota bacterium]